MTIVAQILRVNKTSSGYNPQAIGTFVDGIFLADNDGVFMSKPLTASLGLDTDEYQGFVL